MIESKNCTFRYQNTEVDALCQIDLQIQPGECIVLCGKSGCGKTTFSRLLNGLIPSFFHGELRGECITFGLEAGSAAIEDYVPKVGSVFQNPKTQYFNVDTTAELAFPCENLGMPSAEIRERVETVARDFGLEKLLDRSIFKLSGGEKQRIAFGAACMLNPKLLVLDEPTSNLDYRAIRELHHMIAKKKAEGSTIVIAEHRLAWISDLADRFCYFENGILAGQWATAEFKALPVEALQKMGLRPLNIAPYHIQAIEKSKIKSVSQNPLISAENLSVGYGKKSPVYQINDFQISKGEIVGLMGHNGVGKSTLAKTLCGLLKPISGSITPRREKDRVKHAPGGWPFRYLLAMAPMPPRSALEEGGLLSHLHFQYAGKLENILKDDKLVKPMWYATMCAGNGMLLDRCNIVRALHRLPKWEKLPENQG